jgi:class 3 adenylate cyclase
MRAAIAAYRGREIKTIGDAFLVIFRGAVNAVQCALAAQRGFAEYNAGKRDDERIMVRRALPHPGHGLRRSICGEGQVWQDATSS